MTYIITRDVKFDRIVVGTAPDCEGAQMIARYAESMGYPDVRITEERPIRSV